MPEFLELVGGSGRAYRYACGDGPFSPAGGNFVYLRELPKGRWKVIYAGETESLASGVRDRRAEAEAAHGAVRLFTRLNISGSVRRGEQDDIVRAYEPPMNLPQTVD